VKESIFLNVMIVKNNYEIDYDNYYKRTLRNTKTCTICYPISENSSIKELELRKYIESVYNGVIKNNYRDKYEIDIYLPELNLGFEFNGLYWHNSNKVDKNYHRRKLDFFKERNIRIYNIWEDDWDSKKDIIKSQIKNILKIIPNRIYARKCEIKEITDAKLVRKFLDEKSHTRLHKI
jgi:hypothetical protein